MRARDQTRWTDDGKKYQRNNRKTSSESRILASKYSTGVGCGWVEVEVLMNQTTLICYPSSDSWPGVLKAYDSSRPPFISIDPPEMKLRAELLVLGGPRAYWGGGGVASDEERF